MVSKRCIHPQFALFFGTLATKKTITRKQEIEIIYEHQIEVLKTNT